MDRTAQYKLALTGSPQSLAAVLGAGERDYPICAISLQPGEANANAVYIGSRITMTTSDYGVRLEAAVSGVPPPPWEREFSHGPIRLGSFFVLGTAGQFLYVYAVLWGHNG